MLITNHVLAGALIGSAVPHPTAAFTVGVASHFALDAVPHWGNRISHEAFMRVAVRDGLTGLAVMAATVVAVPPSRRASVLAAMTGAALPDLNKPFAEFLGRSPFPRPVDRFHAVIQNEAPHRMPQEIATAAGLAVAFTATTWALRRALRRTSCTAR